MAKKEERMETPVLVMDTLRPYSASKYVRNSRRVMSPTSMSRLTDRHEGSGQVDKAILVIVNLQLPSRCAHQLIQIETDEAGHQRRGGGDAGDDPARDRLRAMRVRGGDLVVVRRGWNTR